ncbi:hypothetical protein [Halalkalibacter urbisdiaboli]|uniref:hypothetical protein n=1 Tax=Halalkalibacter urbisdiaboli TaxID=1960589 RepID=UPI000B449E20|nr:hypothetical protein [Halalkalibacter urbisdiaboli]
MVWNWKYALVVVVFIALSGCSKQERETFDIFFYSELSSQLQEDTKELVFDSVHGLGEEDVQLFFHPTVLEKMIVDIVAHEGDVFVVDQALINAAFDEEGLIPLDGIIDEADLESIPTQYKSENDETGDVHVHVLPLDNDSLLLRHLQVEVEEQLLAFVPIYSDNQEQALQFLQHVSKREE